jgi:hypothetical protein
MMKTVNTINSLAITDEVRTNVRSDVGKKLTQEQSQITTAKQNRITKKDSLLSNQDILRWYDNLARSSVVTSEEFEKLVTEGWQFLGTLPNGKIVIKNRQGLD